MTPSGGGPVGWLRFRHVLGGRLTRKRVLIAVVVVCLAPVLLAAAGMTAR